VIPLGKKSVRYVELGITGGCAIGDIGWWSFGDKIGCETIENAGDRIGSDVTVESIEFIEVVIVDPIVEEL